MQLTTQWMEQTIRDYFAACNAADKAAIMAFFAPDGTHYFPAGSPFGVLRGAAAIADCWVRCVQELGSHWTVDNFVGDPATRKVAIEWSHFKQKPGLLLRGDEWYRFGEDGRILEIRAYYAAPTHDGVTAHGLGSFDYAGRGYPLQPR